MSTTIDNKVVEMRFDNRQFEQATRQSMSTLDKLKEKLNFKGASKSLEGLNDAAKKVDMKDLSNSVSTVSKHFSALDVIGVTALVNITNSAVNAGKRIAKALTIEPIKTGFNEYELKLDSVKTIMASTGESVEKVNKYLDELNKYSDETIYSFSDMTQNIGKFTNAGVKLEDAVMAIKGISNEAAVSGANANEASRAMYNFAQALSAGYVKLIDWKSIENANMATVEFKEQLIKSAVAAGTLKEAGDGMYETLDGHLMNATRDFNEYLKDEWMTTEVLVGTLKDYADETTEIGKKAKAAAQDVTKFTQMWDILKETAQSGWAKTWELIFGDIDKAKALFTPLTKFFSGIIDKISDARNTLIEGALSSPLGGFAKKIAGIGETVENVTETVKDLGEVVNKVIRGDFGSGAARIKALTDAGYDYAAVQNKVNEKLGSSVRHIEKAVKAQKKNTKQVEELTDAKLEELGLTKQEIKLYRDLEKQSKDTGRSIEDLIRAQDGWDGRTLLLNSFTNIGETIVKIITAIKDAWREVFPPTTSERLYGMIRGFHEFSKTLKISDDTLGSIQSTFKGLFSILKMFVTVIKTVISVGLKLAWSVFQPLSKTILSLTGHVGNFVSKFVTGFTKIKDIAIEVVDGIINKVTEWVDIIKDTELFKSVSEWFEKSGKQISKTVDDIQRSFNNFSIHSFTNKLYDAIDFVGGLVKKLGNNKYIGNILKNIVGAFKSFGEWIGSLEFKMPEFNLDGFAKFGKFMEDNGGFQGPISGIVTFFKYLKNLFGLKVNSLKESALVSISEFYVKSGDMLTAGIDKLKKFLLKVKELVFGTEDVTVMDIVNIINKIILIKTLYKFASALEGLSDPFGSLAASIEQFGKAQKWKAISATFKAMAVALGVLTICMYAISKMGVKEADHAAGILAGTLTMMGGIIAGLMFFASKLNTKGTLNLVGAIGSLLMISASLAILVYALKEIDKTDFKHLGKSFLTMTGMIIVMTGAASILGKYCSGATFKSVAAILTMLTALKLVLDILQIYATYDWDGVKSAVPKMIGMLMMLAVALRVATSGIKDGNTGGLAILVIAMVVALKMLLNSVADFGSMPFDQMMQGILGVILILGGITTMLVALNKSGSGTVLNKGQKSINNFKGLATALLTVTATIYLLGKMDTATLLQGGSAIISILGMFALIMKAMSTVGSEGMSMPKLYASLIGMGAMIGLMAFVVKRLSEVGWKDALGSAGALATLLLGMTGAMAILGKLPCDIKNIGEWGLALVGMSIVVGLLGEVMSGMTFDGAKAVGQAKALSILLLAMSGCLFVCKFIGPMAKEALAGITALGIALGLLTVAVAGIGAFVNFVNGTGALEKGVEVAGLLGQFIGNFVGGIIGGIGAGIVSAIVPMADSLSEFMDRIQPFLAGLKSIDMQMIGGATALSAIIAALGIEAFFNALSLGTMLPALGQSLGLFMILATPFLLGIKSIDATAAAGAEALAKAILALSKAELINGISKLLGAGDLSTFGAKISSFGQSMVDYADSVRNLSEADIKQIETSAKAGTQLANLAAVVPKVGGLVQALLGVGDLSDFGTKICAFAKSLMDYSQTVSGFKDTDATNIEMSAKAGEALAGLSEVIPKVGGLVQSILGESDLSAFGVKMDAFANSLISYAQKVEGFTDNDVKSIKQSAEAGSALAELSESVPKTGGWAQSILGEADMAAFGSSLGTFGDGLMTYAETVSNFSSKDTAAIKATKEGVEALGEVAEKVTKTGGFKQFFSGKIDLNAFGNGVISLAKGLKDYISVSKDIKEEDVTSISNTKDAVSALNDVAGEVSKEGGILSIFGTRDLTGFGTGMSTIATSIVECINVAKGITDGDIDQLDLLEQSVEKLSEASLSVAHSRVNEDSDAGLTTFGNNIINLVNSIKECITTAKGITEEDVSGLTNLNSVISGLSESATSINTSIQETGDLSNVSSFGTAFSSLISSIGDCLSKCADITEDKLAPLDNVKKVIDKLVEASNAITINNFSGRSGVISAFGTAFSSLFGSIVECLTAVSAITEESIKPLDSVKTAVDKMATIEQTVSSTTTDINSSLFDYMEKLVDSITKVNNVKLDNIDNFIGAVTKLGGMNIDTTSLAASTEGVTSSIDSMMTAVNSKLRSGKTTLDNSMKTAMSGLSSVINTTSDECLKAVKALITKLFTALTTSKQTITTACTTMVSGAAGAVESKYGDMKEAGKYLGDGLIAGMAAKEKSVYDAGYRLGQQAVLGEKKGQKSNSPSKLTIQAGKWIGEGLIIGMEQFGSKVYKTGYELGDNAAKSMSNAVSRIKDTLDGNIDTQPTIRPVLDLTDVTAGAASINGMLGINPSVGVLANVGTISATMNARNQNGGTSELISAIGALYNKMGNGSGDTYVVNGITYDDGSNIANAVSSIIREAGIVRRR